MYYIVCCSSALRCLHCRCSRVAIERIRHRRNPAHSLLVRSLTALSSHLDLHSGPTTLVFRTWRLCPCSPLCPVLRSFLLVGPHHQRKGKARLILVVWWVDSWVGKYRDGYLVWVSGASYLPLRAPPYSTQSLLPQSSPDPLPIPSIRPHFGALVRVVRRACWLTRDTGHHLMASQNCAPLVSSLLSS